MEKFNLLDGLNVQRGQLLQWKQLLKFAKYCELLKWIRSENDKLDMSDINNTSGYIVTRGADIDNWVWNNLVIR